MHYLVKHNQKKSIVLIENVSVCSRYDRAYPYNAKIVWHTYTRTWNRRNSYQRLEIH